MESREIKFRAWNGEWMTHFSIGLNNNGGFPILPPCHPEKPYRTLMQYTGLKDKNGKEIYEGDIVVYDNGSNLGGSSKKTRIIKWHTTHNTNGFNLAKGQHFTIVGNIYENKDLLK